MGIEMTLEIDEKLTSHRALELLRANGFEPFEQRGRDLSLYHADSGLAAYFAVEPEHGTVLAEGLVPPKWKRKSRLIFRYSMVNFDASAFETMRFARSLASGSAAYFVLSFQYENVYAVRDEKGYREIPDTTATMKTPVE